MSRNPLLVVGSVALDSVKTQEGQVERAIGGSAVYFSAACCMVSSVAAIGVVGRDYPMEKLEGLRLKGVDFQCVEQVEGKSFFWAGEYSENFTGHSYAYLCLYHCCFFVCFSLGI